MGLAVLAVVLSQPAGVLPRTRPSTLLRLMPKDQPAWLLLSRLSWPVARSGGAEA